VHLSDHRLLAITLLCLAVGWLAGAVIKGSGFGPIGDVTFGWLGALTGQWLLPRLPFHPGTCLAALIVDALIGAVVLLLIVRVLSGNGILYKRRWGRGG
jgi:uncharacterized membrane protein YeaQ/YmgE (transglycosylase-associated protein family)